MGPFSSFPDHFFLRMRSSALILLDRPDLSSFCSGITSRRCADDLILFFFFDHLPFGVRWPKLLPSWPPNVFSFFLCRGSRSVFFGFLPSFDLPLAKAMLFSLKVLTFPPSYIPGEVQSQIPGVPPLEC